MTRIYKAGLLVICLILLVNCASYSPITMGQSAPSNQEIVSCTNYFFGFPYNRANNRIDTVLRQNNLTPAEVSTVEKRTWFYLFPFYMNACTVITLNKEGAQKQGVSSELVRLVAKEPVAVPNIPKKYCKTNTGDLFFHSMTIKCLEDCQRVHPLNQKACEEAYNNKFKK